MALNYIALGRKIKIARSRKRLSQMELAEKIDCSTSYISYIETASKCVSLDKFVDIANALNISADELLKDSLANTERISAKDYSDLLADCDEYERKLITDIAAAAKRSIRQHRRFYQK